MKLALESSRSLLHQYAQEQIHAFTRGLYDEITFLQLIIFHTFGFYFIYLINLSWIFFMRVLAIAFRLILWSWNCNWRKENAASSIFGCDYCTA